MPTSLTALSHFCLNCCMLLVDCFVVDCSLSSHHSSAQSPLHCNTDATTTTFAALLAALLHCNPVACCLLLVLSLLLLHFPLYCHIVSTWLLHYFQFLVACPFVFVICCQCCVHCTTMRMPSYLSLLAALLHFLLVLLSMLLLMSMLCHTVPRCLHLTSYVVPLLRFIVIYTFIVWHCLFYPFDVDAAIQAVADLLTLCCDCDAISIALLTALLHCLSVHHCHHANTIASTSLDSLLHFC